MGFRDYNPGLNRFLTRDSYNGALADMDLGADAWTGNRYAFTGGNPISRIEVDGHEPMSGYCSESDMVACRDFYYTGELTAANPNLDTEKAAASDYKWQSAKINAAGPAVLKQPETQGPGTWAPTVVSAANEAGIDPKFLMAILMIEVGKSERLGPIDDAFQYAQIGLQRLGLYDGFLKDNPPSIGWGNIQEQLFYAMKDAHPEEFAGVQSVDLIGDDPLAIRATAFVLRDLQDQINSSAPQIMKQKYSVMQLTAAAYNIGSENLARESYPTGELGPHGTSYSNAMLQNYREASDMCQSGAWSC
jgi:hypothetical protein